MSRSAKGREDDATEDVARVVHAARIDVELGAEKFAVVVEEITGQERGTAWGRVVAIIPAFCECQKNTSRTIPLMRLTRAN